MSESQSDSPMYGSVTLPANHAEQAAAMADEVVASIPAVAQIFKAKMRDPGQTEWRDIELMLPVAATP